MQKLRRAWPELKSLPRLAEHKYAQSLTSNHFAFCIALASKKVGRKDCPPALLAQ